MNNNEKNRSEEAVPSGDQPQERLPGRRRHRVVQVVKTCGPRVVKALIEHGPDIAEWVELLISTFFG